MPAQARTSGPKQSRRLLRVGVGPFSPLRPTPGRTPLLSVWSSIPRPQSRPDPPAPKPVRHPSSQSRPDPLAPKPIQHPSDPTCSDTSVKFGLKPVPERLEVGCVRPASSTSGTDVNPTASAALAPPITAEMFEHFGKPAGQYPWHHPITPEVFEQSRTLPA